MDWDDLKVFEIVASVKTLSAAARHLKVSVATVARRIDGLEKSLGLKLVDRTPEGILLTADGEALSGQATIAAAAMESVRRRADALRSGAMHPIRISTTEPIAAELLAPALPRIIDRLPELTIELAVSAEIVSLATRSFDIALRLSPPKGDSLQVQRLPAFSLGLYTTSRYLGSRTPDMLDLRKERLLTYDNTYGPISEVKWVEDNDLGGAARVRTSSTRTILNATLAGAGIGMLPDIFARRHESLIRIPDFRPIPERVIWLVSHKDQKRSVRHRLVRAWIFQTLHEATKSV